MQTLSLSSAIDAAREFIDTTNGIVHVDTILYSLFIQALYQEHITQIESYIELLYQIWLDPSPENIIFLPDCMQHKFVHFPDFSQVVEHVYPEDHHEKIAFLDFMSRHEKISPALIMHFVEETKMMQRQKLIEQKIRVVAIEDTVHHDGPHMVVITCKRALPAYSGDVRMIMIEEKKNIVLQPVIQDDTLSTIILPTILPIKSIQLLFNDPQLFHERYVLNLRPPYRPTHHINTRALKDFLLFDKPIQTKTVFDQHQITTMKEGFEKFKTTLPTDVTWNKEVLYDVPNTTQTLHGVIDLIWDGGLYQLTRRTPPSRSALLNGINPELPLLAASYNQNITHVGYIHLQGHLEDTITITRYNDPSALASENIKKLAHYYSRSQEKST